MRWTTDHREWYRDVYLKSEHWKRLRSAKLYIDPKCQHCKTAKATDVHHVNYREIFDVTLDDLLSLCRPCHSKEHEINGMPKRDREKFRNENAGKKKKPKSQSLNPLKGYAAYHIHRRKCLICDNTVEMRDCILFAVDPTRSFALSNAGIRCKGCSQGMIQMEALFKKQTDIFSESKSSGRMNEVLRVLSSNKSRLSSVKNIPDSTPPA